MNIWSDRETFWGTFESLATELNFIGPTLALGKKSTVQCDAQPYSANAKRCHA